MSSSQPAPQFDKADFGQQTTGDVCHRCRQSAAGTYYRANGAMTCASCANILQHESENQPGGRFTRALLFGVGGALLGLILYSAVGIITGLEIGYVSLAVGFIVAKAILKGSGGVGGRKYQIAAVVLTYVAVSMSAVPITIHAMRENGSLTKQSSPASKPAPAPSSSARETGEPTSTANSASQSASDGSGKANHSKPVGFFLGLAILAGIGLASPFLALSQPISGIIGLVILLVGMNIAWKMTAGTSKPLVDGPFTT